MTRTSTAALFALLAWGSLALGQESAPSTADLEARLEAQQRELDEVKAKLSALGGEGEATAAAESAANEDAAKDDDSWTDKVRLGLFYVESADKNFRLDVRVRIQVDGRYVFNRRDFNDDFHVRRARVEFKGHLWERLYYDFGLEFSHTSDADARNAFLELRFCKEFALRAGQFLLPYSDERLNSSKYLNHPERSVHVASIVGQRDIGIMFRGNFADLVRYQLAFIDGEGQNKKVDTDDDPDTAARIELTPFGNWNLAFSVNYIYSPTNRKHTGPADMKTVGNHFSKFITYQRDLNGDGTIDNHSLGRRQRFGGGFRFSQGPFEIKGEANGDYHEEVFNDITGRKDNLLNWSYFVDVTYVLTGETLKQTHDGAKVTPKQPFYDPETKAFGLGAFQISVRYEELFVDPSTVKRGYAAGVDRLRAVATTFHWYMWKNVRFSLNYTYSHFDSQGYMDSRGHRHVDDHGVLGRLAFFF